MRLRPILLLATACLTVFASIGAQAGRGCIDHQVTRAELQSALQVASDVKQVLQRQSARFAFIARFGSDISEHGLRITHAGFARKRDKDGAWVVVHQLTSCGKSGSGLNVQGLGTFMLDNPLTHDVLVLTFGKTLATHVEAVSKDRAPRRFYDPRYNMMSYLGSPAKYQDSNQWVLKLIALAQAKADGKSFHTRDETHRHYRQRGFQDSVIRISSLRRSLAKLSATNIRFDDQPPSSHRDGRYEIVSVKSVVDNLQFTGNAAETITVSGPYRRVDRTPDKPEESPNGD